jgi:arylsulfatase A-like enzyme
MSSIRVCSVVLLIWASAKSASVDSAHAAERPNILWISCEDISSHLGCYGDPVATTPHLDALAAEGVLYTHAFTCHGVCAPSRTGIITGMYPIALGANHMRSKATLPDHVRCFPEYLRNAGYYCTNNSKTDYNFSWKPDNVWDETSRKAHWRRRPNPNQPFFAVFNLTMTHESRIWRENWQQVVAELEPSQFHTPESVTVPELYPDTPEVRAAIARLHDLITLMDARVGELLAEVEEAGLAENTIVIFWSDHGDGFARAKRWVYDTGTRVPMIARIPESCRTANQGQPGSVDDQLINLIDLGPTMLNLAGIPVPPHMQGQPFLGDHLPAARNYIYGARDRIDERFDMVRSVRDRRFRYVRNFMPWHPALQHINYSERSATRQALRQAYADRTLSSEAGRFLTAPRADEELYDLEVDALELNNLVDDAAFEKHLQRLRDQCTKWQTNVRDAHLLPESILIEDEQLAGSRATIFASEAGFARWNLLFDAAMGRFPASEGLSSPDAAVRWWTMVHATDDADVLLHGLKDKSPAVRIAAARFLFQHAAHRSKVAPVLARLLKSPEAGIRHAAVLAVDELGNLGQQLRKDVEQMDQNDNYIKTIVRHILDGPAFPVEGNEGSN